MCAELGEDACLLRDDFKAVSQRKYLSPRPPLFQRTGFLSQVGFLVGSPASE